MAFEAVDRSVGSAGEPPRVEQTILSELAALLESLPMPASKDELAERAAKASEPLRWLLDAIPGGDFQFASDVLSTARIALEMDIDEPWPEHAKPWGGYVSDAGLVDAVGQRLVLCPETNAHLIRVSARDGIVYLEGRTPDVPRGVMATRAAAGVVPGRRVVNRLQVLA